jgi:hypothetical protein
MTQEPRTEPGGVRFVLVFNFGTYSRVTLISQSRSMNTSPSPAGTADFRTASPS